MDRFVVDTVQMLLGGRCRRLIMSSKKAYWIAVVRRGNLLNLDPDSELMGMFGKCCHHSLRISQQKTVGPSAACSERSRKLGLKAGMSEDLEMALMQASVCR